MKRPHDTTTLHLCSHVNAVGAQTKFIIKVKEANGVNQSFKRLVIKANSIEQSQNKKYIGRNNWYI